MARFTHNGVEYEELGNGKVRVVGQAAAQQPFTVTALPLTPEQQRDATRKDEDQQFQRNADARAAARDRRDQQAADLAKAKFDKENAETQTPGDTSLSGEAYLASLPRPLAAQVQALAEGRRAFPTGAALRSPQVQELVAAATQFDPTLDAANAATRVQTRKDFTSGLMSRNITAMNTALGHLGTLSDATAGLDNSSFPMWNSIANAAETAVGDPRVKRFTLARDAVANELMKVFRGSGGSLAEIQEWKDNIDSSGSPEQLNAAIQQGVELLNSRLEAVGDQYSRGMGRSSEPMQFLSPHAREVYTKLTGGPDRPQRDKPASVWQQTYSTPGGPPGAAPSGSTSQGKPIDPAMQGELDAYIRQQGKGITEQGLSQFIMQLYGKYGHSVEPGLEQYATDTVNAIRNGGQINTNIPPETVPLDGASRFRNDLVSNPFGAAAASWGNAGGFGIPSLVAGEQFNALRNEHPVASLVGEIGGGIAGTMATGAALGAIGSRVASPAARGILTNPLTADIAYGSAYGATQAEDPIYGAIGGGLAGAAGNVVGKNIGGWLGSRGVSDTLNRGERAVFDGIDQPTVESALLQGKDLGLPLTLADVDPVAAALTGSAIRRNPAVAGQAREILAQRSQGQLDRLREGVTRDLGPLDNVAQRADDLIAQARAKAGPLYDEAYATPVPSTPEIESLLATPFGKQALSRSRTIAANERRSPTELGYALDGEGNIVLNPAPNDLVAQHLMARDALTDAQRTFKDSRLTTGYDRKAGLENIATARQGLRDVEAELAAAPTPGARSSVPNYTTEALDYTKRGMDDILEQSRNPITGKLELDEMGRSQNDVLRGLLGQMDELNPAYGQARAAYAGPAAEREALYQGRAAVTENPDLVAIQAGRQTPERLQMMQLGARDRLMQGAEALSNSTNPYRVLNTPAMEKRLAALYPENAPDVARLLMQRDLEGKMAATSNSLVGNSATAERQAADRAFDDEGLLRPILEGGIETAVTGAPVMTVLRSGVGRRIADTLRLGAGKRAMEQSEQIAPITLNPDPTDTIAQILALQERNALYQAAAGARRRLASERGGHAGGGTGSAVAAALMRN